MESASVGALSQAVWPVADLGAYLRGTWGLNTLGWSAGGPPMRLSGRAVFQGGGDAYRLVEQGTVVMGEYRGEASRCTLFRCEGAGAVLSFEDGRAFHDLDLSAGVAGVVHACAPDRYRGRYRVAGPNVWWRGWIVTGARKRQVIVSRFVRAV